MGVDEQREVLWRNARARAARRAARATAPPPPRPPSSGEVAEQRARWHDEQGMPASAAAIRAAAEDQPDLYPRNEEPQ